jgi:hypothetical protein
LSVPLVAALATLLVGMLVEYVLTPGLAVAIVFAVPLVIAARFCSTRMMVALGVVAVGLSVLDQVVERISPRQLAIDVLALVIIFLMAVQVADQGFGIAPAAIDELFQPFARLGRAREATGTGLGLYVYHEGDCRGARGQNLGRERGGTGHDVLRRSAALARVSP